MSVCDQAWNLETSPRARKTSTSTEKSFPRKASAGKEVSLDKTFYSCSSPKKNAVDKHLESTQQMGKDVNLFFLFYFSYILYPVVLCFFLFVFCMCSCFVFIIYLYRTCSLLHPSTAVRLLQFFAMLQHFHLQGLI